MSGSVVMNVFRQDPFSAVTLTEQVNKFPYLPQMLGQLGIFEDLPIRTTALQIDERDGQLVLIPTSTRGAPKKQRVNDLRRARYFNCPRLATEDTIYSYQLQNLRSDDPNGLLQTLAMEVQRRLTGPTGLTSNMELTWEYHRLGAVQGVLLDSNGAVINNWFNEFGITPTAPFALNLTQPVVIPTGGTQPTGTQPPGALKKQFNQIVRAMKRNGKGAFIDNVTQVHALAGDTLFDNLIAHPDVTATYQNWTAAPFLRTNTAFDDFNFGGITWHNYRGTDDMTTVAIPANMASFFPVNAPGVFKRALAPGEAFDDMNQLGREMYVNRNMDPSETPSWVEFDLLSFPLHICTRPEMLLTATM